MGNKQTVLIVDDIVDNLNVAANALIRQDINVIFAQNGEEALRNAEKFFPDLILLDIMMPGMNGFEVCQRLKSNTLTKDIPIIFLTAVGETKNIVKGFKLGAVDYINKPFISEELISRVWAHLTIYNLNKELNLKNIEISQNHDKIMSNIKYAQGIQNSLLPKHDKISEILKNSFLFFKPKDIVSGDFYYVNKINKNIIFSVADCTGHGVTGGFLTMLGITFLHEINNENKTNIPGEILDKLRKKIKETFKVFGTNSVYGLDIAFCTINQETNILNYAGAFNPLWIVRNGKHIEYEATRNPIGIFIKETPFKNRFSVEKEFKTHNIQLQNNDKIYIFSDGYKDQRGGEDFKKFNNKRFRELILEISDLPMKVQKNKLKETLEKWQAKNEQIDDITIMGLEWSFSDR